jgi:hypothetical protein
MIQRRMSLLTGLVGATLLLLACSTPARAGLNFNGGVGAISFGVAPYGGGPNNGGPTYIGDNVTGLNDILTSPGGGYQTASPVIANNTLSIGGAVPALAALQAGGGNGFGAFGSGAMINTGSTVGVSLTDSGPGGGTASYAIGTGVVTYTVAGAAVAAGTTYGAYLSMAGAVPLVNSADVMSLRVSISDTMGALNVALPQMVLAIGNLGGGNYNIVTIGGAGGGNAGMIFNPLTGAFTSLAVDNAALAAALPVGDVLTVRYALTAYADPASLDTFDPTGDLALLNLTGPLPSLGFVDTPSFVPEPASILMVGMAGLMSLGYAWRRRKTKAAA